MPELQRLDAHHAQALLHFERENRAYFAQSVPDRGDDYFTEFAARHAARLAVLRRTGFVPVGEVLLDGQPGVRHVRELIAPV